MLKWGLKELLREHEKGVLRAAHSRTPFQGEYPPLAYIAYIILMYVVQAFETCEKTTSLLVSCCKFILTLLDCQ